MAHLKLQTPGKVIAVGLNYRSHAAELGMAVPDEPVLFIKPPSAVIAAGEAIVLPPSSRQVDYEAELAVVIGKTARSVGVDVAAAYVLGYTCANDVTARDLQKRDGQWTRSKSFDTFCPLGPWVESVAPQPDSLVELLLNGEILQSAPLSDMIFSPLQLVAFISGVMTLERGDVILTGTPPGVGPINAGDKVTVRIDGIGELVNDVVLPGV
ncbi:MAG: fumarylacetoacetate hydrolase family protein [Thermoleophilia bacterium]|jgi:2-keto-4-pentenoate hydratase/2-oxohepta-3-ene-1,7-dioic acid hydratase in catechol pathway